TRNGRCSRRPARRSRPVAVPRSGGAGRSRAARWSGRTRHGTGRPPRAAWRRCCSASSSRNRSAPAPHRPGRRHCPRRAPAAAGRARRTYRSRWRAPARAWCPGPQSSPWWKGLGQRSAVGAGVEDRRDALRVEGFGVRDVAEGMGEEGIIPEQLRREGRAGGAGGRKPVERGGADAAGKYSRDESDGGEPVNGTKSAEHESPRTDWRETAGRGRNTAIPCALPKVKRGPGGKGLLSSPGRPGGNLLLTLLGETA